MSNTTPAHRRGHKAKALVAALCIATTSFAVMAPTASAEPSEVHCDTTGSWKCSYSNWNYNPGSKSCAWHSPFGLFWC